MKKVTVRLRRLAVLPVAAAGLVAVTTAAAYPAQGAAAQHRPEPVRVRLEGGTLRVQGTEANDAIALRLAAGDPTVVQVDLGDDGTADFTFPRAAIDNIKIAAHGGDDTVRIDDTNGAFTDTIPTRIEGGPGNDTISGGAGAETLVGGAGNDTIDGKGGNDTADLGPGDDSFVWDPGDGSDSIEGQDRAPTRWCSTVPPLPRRSTYRPTGTGCGSSARPANITMDTHGVEQVDFNALGGADTVTVNDLSRTDVKNVNVDLAGTLGGTTGDGQADRVLVTGTSRNDAVNVAGDASGVTVSGLKTQVAIQHQEPTDQLFVEALGGNDAISATGLASGAISELPRRRRRQRHDRRRTGRGNAPRRQRQRHDRRKRGQRPCGPRALATTRSSGTRATAATRSRARTAGTRWSSTAQPSRTRSTSRRTVIDCGSSATSGNITMDVARSRASALQRARRRRYRHGE